jgi:ABC-type oligopeptide transport system substrate-binding subunit
MTGVGEGRIAAALFEGLTRLDPETLEVLPGAARSWEVSEDERTWIFSLRGDSRWTDGSPVGAADFRYSWLRVLDPATASPYAGLLFDVEGARGHQAGRVPAADVGITAPDDRTLVVRLERPVPYFPSLAAFFTLLPVPRSAVAAHGDRWTRPGNIVTNGPFRLAGWRFYREIVLERNEGYRDPERVKADRIRLVPVVDPNTQFNLFETGALDVAFSVPSPILHRLRGREDFVNGPRLATAFLRLNVTRPPLDDPGVRRAIGQAVDRESVVERITRGGERASGSLVPPVLPAYVPAEGLPYDATAARAALDAAGHPSGSGIPALALLYPARPEYASLAVFLQRQLERVLGLDIRLDAREWKVYIAAMRRLDYDLALGQWIGDYPDPTTFLGCFLSDSGNNRTGWRSAAYDALLREAEEVRAGESPRSHALRRLALFRKAERLLVEREAPIVPLYHPTVRFLVSPRVRGFVPNVMGLVSLADLSRAEAR